jgi:KipI family sensor histidine kinase inhibitor
MDTSHPPPPFPRLRSLGDAALVVEFSPHIDEATHAQVMGLAHALEQARAQGSWVHVLECVPAYTTLTVHFSAAGNADHAQDAAEALLALARNAASLSKPGRQWRLPMCFDADFAPDLPELAQARGLSVQAAMALLTRTPFRVYMLGFQPGFPYMGGLPAELEMPRRASPRTAVPERSVAIAGRMCAVYPWRSPGGWHLVGRTPLRLFEAQHANGPAWLQAGDEVRWFAVSRERFDAIEEEQSATGAARSLWLDGAAQTP